MSPFRFVSDTTNLSDRETLFLQVPVGLSNKSELFIWFAENLRFPSYFGFNWDAFEECLRDLSWIEQPKLVIAHRDVPLANNCKEQQFYLTILAGVVQYWEADPSRKALVVFDPNCEPIVNATCGNP